MERLYDLIACSESWLAERILSCIRRNGYGSEFGTQEDAWRSSVSNLSVSLGFLKGGGDAPTGPFHEKGSAADPASSFGVLEAKRHDELGVDLRFSLVLLRFYRRICFDLVRGGGFSREEGASYHRFLGRFFDRVEEVLFLERERLMIDERGRYLMFFESLPGPAILLDEDGRVENMNRSAAAMLGEDTLFGGTGYVAKWRGKPLPLFADDLARFHAAEVQARALEKTVGTPAGKRLYQGEMRRMRHAKGNFGRTAILLTDLTKRRETEETLQVVLEEMEERIEERKAEAARSRNLLSTLMHNATEGIYLKDLGGRYLMVNPAASRIFGKAAEEIVGKSDRDLFPLDQAERIARFDREALHSGETRVYELPLTFAGAPRRVYSTELWPWKDGVGNIIGLVGVARPAPVTVDSSSPSE